MTSAIEKHSRRVIERIVPPDVVRNFGPKVWTRPMLEVKAKTADFAAGRAQWSRARCTGRSI